MARLGSQNLDYMRDAVFFDGPETKRRLTRFWTLLLLSAVIAAAGVVTDSTATVIGAMIVAPLMTPIQGTMLGVVLGDRKNLVRSLGLVVAGAAAAVAIGFVLGVIVANPPTAATNGQVAGRVNPNLVDLLAALATGAVGSIALVRRDISDTLPGVAIAISLVPPLSVVGLTLAAHQYSEAGGAMLLFITNVAAILGIGTIVMALYGVHRMVAPGSAGERREVNRRNAVIAIAALVLVVAVPLSRSSFTSAHETNRELAVHSASVSWANSTGWRLISVTTSGNKVITEFGGALPYPSTASLRADIVAMGVDPSSVQVVLVPQHVEDLGSTAGS